jgi:uncharacterized damage-inducible protein DinB
MLLIVTAPWQERVIPYRLYGSGFDDPDFADAGRTDAVHGRHTGGAGMKALEKYAAIEGQMEQTVKALEGISQEEFDWKPVQHEKVRTIGDMMRHVVSAEDTFINRFVMGKDAQPRTPQTHRTPESLTADFTSLRGQTIALMRQWDENDLKKSYAAFRGNQMTLDQILQILIGHEIGHRSQMLLMRRWKNPDR